MWNHKKTIKLLMKLQVSNYLYIVSILKITIPEVKVPMTIINRKKMIIIVVNNDELFKEQKFYRERKDL